jgi:hypothetical protein
MTLRLVGSMDWERPSEGFLAYLERLSQACLDRNRQELDKLLRMRFSSHLPRTVLDELEYFRRVRSGSLRAPLRLLRYLHQLRQLAQTPPERTQLTLELRPSVKRSTRRGTSSVLRRVERRRK